MFDDPTFAIEANDTRRFSTDERRLLKRLLMTGCFAVLLLIIAFVW